MDARPGRRTCSRSPLAALAYLAAGALTGRRPLVARRRSGRRGRDRRSSSAPGRAPSPPRSAALPAAARTRPRCRRPGSHYALHMAYNQRDGVLPADAHLGLGHWAALSAAALATLLTALSRLTPHPRLRYPWVHRRDCRRPPGQPPASSTREAPEPSAAAGRRLRSLGRRRSPSSRSRSPPDAAESLASEKLKAARVRDGVERAVCALVAGRRAEQVVGPVAVERPLGLLGVEAGAREVPVGEPRARSRCRRSPSPSASRPSARAAGARRPRRSRRRRPPAGRSAAPAAASGGSFARHHVNCGVFSAGSCTIVTRTLEPSCRSSVRTDSRKPWSACFAPQYGACSGIPAVREGRADLDDRPAVARPHPAQRGQRPPDRAEVGDLGGPAELLRLVSHTGAKTVAIALLTQTSIGPSSSSISLGGGLDLLGVGDVGLHAPAAGGPSSRASPRAARARGRSARRRRPRAQMPARSHGPTPAEPPVTTTLMRSLFRRSPAANSPAAV